MALSALREIYEVHGDAALGEETQRLARTGAFLDAEDLDLHPMTLSEHRRSSQSAAGGRELSP